MSQPKATLSRRTLFAGAGTATAVAAAATLIPAGVPGTPALPAAAKAPPANGGGYSLTDHVKQYYKSALV